MRRFSVDRSTRGVNLDVEKIDVIVIEFKPPVQTPIDHETQVDNSHMGTNNNDPKIWIPLPYIGKYGT